MFKITNSHLPEGPRAGNAWVEELVDQIIEAGHTAFEITSDVRKTHPFFARGTLGQAVISMIQKALDERLSATA